MRIITVVLLLIVCFFGGMMYGSFEKNQHIDIPQSDIVEQEMEQVNTVVDIEMIESELVHIEDQDYKVHKTASFLEKIVTTVYEFIIQLMYQIANLFFD